MIDKIVWTQDGDLEGPASDVLDSRHTPPDWQAWVKTRGLHMHLQFGSIRVSREEAERIVADVLRGLNSRPAP